MYNLVISQERKVSYVLIRGTTSGLGREVARLFAQNGYNIVAVARNEVLLQQQKQELERQFGIEMVYVVKDLSAENSAQEVYDEIKHKGINIDILINNAGFGSVSYTHLSSVVTAQLIATSCAKILSDLCVNANARPAKALALNR